MKDKIDDILYFLSHIILFPYFLFIIFPKELWDNRKNCPYWDYPYCKKKSLMTGKTKPCGLGDAKNYCLHYKSKIK